MMKFECDMCRKEIGQQEGLFIFRLPIPEDKVPFSRQFHSFTVCPRCAMKMSAFIKEQAVANEGGEDNGKDEVVQEKGHEAT